MRVIKRSRGVTVLALLFFTVGAYRGFGCFETLAVGMGREFAQVQGAISELSYRPSGAAVAAELRRMAGEARRATQSLAFRVGLALRGLIFAMLTFAGVGMFSLQPWARRLAIWHAWLDIPVSLWMTLGGIDRPVRRFLVQLTTVVLSDERGSLPSPEVMRSMFVAPDPFWLVVSTTFAWNLVIIWTLTQPWLVEQFEPPPEDNSWWKFRAV